MTSLLWRIAAAGLFAALVVCSIGWGLAAHDRNQARAKLVAERTRGDELRASIREQNRAVDALAAAKTAADARGLAAQQLAAANGKRFDGALQRLAGVRATTCAEAMPAVNQLLEAIR